MAGSNISSLDELAITPADSDELIVVDKSDTTMGSGGTDKRVKTSTIVRRGNVFYPEDFGAVGDDSTNDTDALQDCIDAAIAVGGTVQLDQNKIYRADSTPRTDRGGNSILSITDGSLNNVIIQGGDPLAGWSTPQQATIKTTLTGQTYSSSFGPPSVIGGTTDENARTFIDCGTVSIRNVKIAVPTDPSIAGIDALSFGGFDFLGVNVVAGTGTDMTSAQTHAHAFGFRTGSQFGFGNVRWNHCKALQMYAGFVLYHADHLEMDSAEAWHCQVALAQQDDMTGATYPIVGGYFIDDENVYGLAGWLPDTGVQSLSSSGAILYISNLIMSTENLGGDFATVKVILDANNRIKGNIQHYYFTGLGVSGAGPSVTGANNLKISTVHPAIATVASAGTITAPSAADKFTVTGTTTITSINASWPSREITIVFTSTAQITDGSNLKLNGNFTGGADRVLVLLCDGTNWLEVSRSAN